MIHGCWSLAAVLAFGWGSRSGDPGSLAGAGETATGWRDSAAGLVDAGGEESLSPNGKRRIEERDDGMLSRIFGKVAVADGSLDSLIAQAMRDPNPITRRLAFSRLLEAMTPENAAAIREQMVALGADREQLKDFHYSWGAISGKEAFDHASTTPEGDLADTMTGWAAANPSEALALLDNLPAELQGQREELTASVVSGLAHRDLSLATDLVFQLGGQGNERAANLMEIVANETLRTEGAAAAAAWAEALPDGALKGTAMSRVAEAYVRNDPAAAARWAGVLAGKDYAAGAVREIGGHWAESDPTGAVGWLESLPPGMGQIAGLREVFGGWEDSDPVAAGNYLLAMPQSEKRDSAISGFATGYAWQNPEVAISWAESISDPTLRQNSLNQAGHAFYRRDPQGALAWMDSTGMPPETRQQIMTPRNRR